MNLSGHVDGAQADIPRLLQGKVGGQVKESVTVCMHACIHYLYIYFIYVYSFGQPSWVVTRNIMILHGHLLTRLM